MFSDRLHATWLTQLKLLIVGQIGALVNCTTMGQVRDSMTGQS